MKTDNDAVTGPSDTNGDAADPVEDGTTAEATAEPVSDGSDEKPATAADPPKPAAGADTPKAAASTPGVEPASTEPASTEPASTEPKVSKAEPEATTAEPEATNAAGSAEPEGTNAAEPARADAPKSGIAGLRSELLPPSTPRAWALVAVLLVALAGLGWGGYRWFTTLPDGVALRVNGVSVTDQQFDDQLQTLTALYGVRSPGPEDPAKQDSFRRDVAKTVAVGMAMDGAAAERQIVVADRQVQDYLTKYVAATYGEGQAGRDAFVKDLSDKATSEPKVLAEIKRQMTNKQLFAQVAGDGPPITDDEVKQAFEARKAEFATPERREIHNIVVKTRPEADALLAEIKAGGNFEALAAQRSLDEITKGNGGNLGLVMAQDLQKEYSDAAFSAPAGTVIGPLVTQQKSGPTFNVGKVVQIQPSVPADYEQIKEGVRRLLAAERADAKWRTFTQEQIKAADIEYADKYRPADPTGVPPIGTAPAAPAGAEAPAPPR